MELALEGANNAFPDLEALPYAVTLFQFGFCFLLPLVTSGGASLDSFPRTLHGAIPYISLSCVVFGSTCFASIAVRYVSYPTKVVLKSAKLIPTMVVATVLQRGSQYSLWDYTAASLLCAGAAGYSWGSGTPRGNEDQSWWGITLLLVSVCCDAFTPNIQQRLMAPPAVGVAALPTTMVHNHTTSTPPKYPPSFLLSWCGKFPTLFLPPHGGGMGLSASALMTNANGIGCMGLLMFMALNGSLTEAMVATCLHPLLLGYLVLIGVSLATAVLCYTRLIQQAGSVVAVAVATLRKVATIVLSYVVYPKVLSQSHALSALLVVGGILMSSYARQRNKK
eukprot:scaffold516_cov175-Amphora_coffeaeformis.AAC.33